MKRYFLLLIFGFGACINPQRPAPDKNCHSDTECPLGWYCDPETRVCMEGADVLQQNLKDATIIDAAADVVEVASGCLEGKQCNDYDPCTYNDKCTKGECKGTAYSCTSDKSCVISQCLGNGDCRYTVKNGYCLIGGQCVQKGSPDPDNQCKACVPEVTRYAFSNDDSLSCDDNNESTTNDHCNAGTCVGTEEAE